MPNSNPKACKMNEEAVSPVIGVILMVAITVVLAAIVFLLVSDLGGPSEVPPAISFREDGDSLTVIGADQDLAWEDFTVTGCTTVPTGAVDAGDQIEACSGRVTIKHDPSNSLVFDGEM